MRRFLIAVGIAVAGLAGCRDTYDSAIPVAPTSSVHTPKSFDGIVYQGRDNGIYMMNDDGTNVRTIVASSSERTRMLTSVGEDRLVYFEGPTDGTTISYHAIDLDGEDHALLRESTMDSTEGLKLENGCVISPDGTRAIYCTWGLDADDAGGPDLSGQHYLHIVDTRDPRGPHPIVTYRKDVFLYPSFSPDGKHIAFFGINTGEGWDLMMIESDGTGLRTVASGVGSANEIVWSPDGSTLAVSPFDSDGRVVLYSAATGSSSTITIGGRHLDGISWSPDGTRIAYTQEYVENGNFFRRVAITDLNGSVTTLAANNGMWYVAAKWAADGASILVQAYTVGGLENNLLGLLNSTTGHIDWIKQNAMATQWIP